MGLPAANLGANTTNSELFARFSVRLCSFVSMCVCYSTMDHHGEKTPQRITTSVGSQTLCGGVHGNGFYGVGIFVVSDPVRSQIVPFAFNSLQ